MSDLPKGWANATVADTGDYINGFAFAPTDWGDTGRPIIRIQNLTDPDKPINRTKTQVPNQYIVSPGDILVSWSATLDAFIWNREESLLNQHIFRVLPDERLVGRRYLFYLLKQLISEMLKTEHLHGSTMKHINRGPFMAHRAPIAPRQEQDRIVAEIEKQFTRLDAATAALRRVQANLKRYRASVLKAACEGRLVLTEAELARKEGRGYEPASELLKRILRERRARWEADTLAKMIASGKRPTDDRWKQKYKEPSAPDTTNLPELPDGWCWVSLGQLIWSVKDGPHYSPKYSPEGVPFITGGQVRPSGIDFGSAKFISRELHEELSRRCRPEKGDVLLTKGGTTGIARVNTYDVDFSVWVHVAVLKPVNSVEPFYLQHALNSPFCYAQSQRYTHGVGNQDLGLTRMVNIVLALPPLSEQVRINGELDRRFEAMDRLEAALIGAMEHGARLKRSTLCQAFSGRLVPQDPTDDPASALLERIRAERNDGTGRGKPNNREVRRGRRRTSEFVEVG